MKTKNILLKTLFSIIAFIVLLLVANTSKAETFQPIGTGTSNRSITNAQFSDITAGKKKIWQYTKSGSTSIENLYCANEGETFYGSNTYTGYNIYDASKKSTYKVISTNYNKIIWILDNMYIGYNVKDETRTAMLSNLKRVTGNKSDVNAAIDAINSSEDRDEIFYEVFQCLLWNYTANTTTLGGVNGIYYKSTANVNALTLYKAMKEIADNKGSYTSQNASGSNIKTYINSLSIDDSNAKIDGSKVGPFTIKNYDNTKVITESWKVTIDGTEYKNGTDYDIQQNAGQFYINFKSSVTILTECTVNVTLTSSAIQTTGKYWVQTAGGQQLISVEKTVVSHPTSGSVSKESQYCIKVVKKDYKTGADVEGAKVTVKSGNETLLNNESTPTKTVGPYTDTKDFSITEDSAPNGYVNVFSGLTIKIRVTSGDGYYKSSLTDIVDENGKSVKSKYQKYVQIVNNKSTDANYTIEIRIKDPETIDLSIKVVKRSKKTNDYLEGAKFKLDVGTDKDNIVAGFSRELVTDENGSSNIETYTINDINTQYSFFVSETEAPAGYEIDEPDKVTEIIAKVDDEGNLTVNDIDSETEKVYIDEDEDGNSIIVYEKYDSPKEIEYGVKIVKVDAVTGEEITDKDFDIRGFVVDDCPDKSDISRYSFKFTNGGNYTEKYTGIAADTDLTPIWVTEYSAPDGYENNLGVYNQNGVDCYVFAKFIPHIDKDGNLTVTGASSDGGFLFFVNPETGVLWGFPKTSKFYKYIEDPVVETIDGVQTIVLKIKDQPKIADLALRKFITKVDNTDVTDRIPDVDISSLVDGTSTTATYTHTKEPVLVAPNQVVTYTIRVYNEADQDGCATKIMDDIPDGLEFLPENSTNTQYKWVMYKEVGSSTSTDDDTETTLEDTITYNNKKYVKTENASEADLIVTDYLDGEVIKKFDKDTMTELDYKDVQVAFKVVEPSTSDRIIINSAQITEDSDGSGNDMTDRDSTPNEWNGEDDEDIEKVKVLYFDLALRKWVTQAIVTENGQTYVTETGHQAEDDPEDVVKVDLKKSKLNDVTVKFKYSIRITNEGQIAGEATEIRDDIPDGLKFVAEDNPDWYESDGKIVTNKLAGTTLQPGESAEVEIILTWVNSTENMGVMVNTAEISKDHNEYGTPDIDSTPGNYVPGEDDIDDAPVMLTVKTGSEIIGYVSLALGFVAIIAIGVSVIKRKI